MASWVYNISWAYNITMKSLQTTCLVPQGLYNKMVEAFKKMGLVVVPGLGSLFDPEVCAPKELFIYIFNLSF